MITLSTHVLDGSDGGGLSGVKVTVTDDSGGVVASGVTGDDGRVAELAAGLSPGRYRIEWQGAAGFLLVVGATVELSGDRHYHLPLLASGASATVYLGV